MKHTFKKLLGMVSLVFAFALSAQADIAIYNPTSTSTASILQQGAAIQQIQFSNAATNAVTITFTDCPTNVTTYTVGAYTNIVYTIPNTVTTFTRITGGSQSSTNATLTGTPTLVAASTNNYRQFLIQTIPASSSITWTPPQSQYVGFGLAASTTATNVVATVIYQRAR